MSAAAPPAATACPVIPHSRSGPSSWVPLYPRGPGPAGASDVPAGVRPASGSSGNCLQTHRRWGQRGGRERQHASDEETREADADNDEEDEGTAGPGSAQRPCAGLRTINSPRSAAGR